MYKGIARSTDTVMFELLWYLTSKLHCHQSGDGIPN